MPSIYHFMWGYQPHFRGSVEVGARRILETLKPGLDAKAFLVGVRIANETGKPGGCVEPEIHHWAQSSDFYDVLEDVPSIQESYDESQSIQSNPIARDRVSRRLFLRAIRDAVMRRLEASPAFPADTQLFASHPAERDGFYIITIITVAKSVLDSIPRLMSDRVFIHKYSSIRIPRSLVEATIDRIFTKCNEAVVQIDAGADLGVLGSSDEILRAAASDFFAGLLKQIDRDGQVLGVATETFDTLTRLSLTPYERAEPKGIVIFAESEAVIGKPVLSLASPLRLSEKRAFRKLLELANDGLALRCNCDKAFSLVRDWDVEIEDNPAWIAVQIIGRGRWTVSRAGEELMVMTDGFPSLPHPVIDESEVSSDIRRLLPSITEDVAWGFARIATRLASVGHGSIVIISEAAQSEAVRLGRDSLLILPLALNPNLAAVLSRIDGALLCDLSINCHAVGVILDGKSSASGDRGRGSRFNSALRYVSTSESPAVALVVSDDGGLDLLPKMRPSLSRALLESRCAEMGALARNPASPPDREREAEVENWLRDHAYYLDSAQCEQVNQWIAICDERAFAESSVRITFPPLKPDPTFVPSRDLV